MPITTLSSSEFSRNVDRAIKAAENGPVFITYRGRPAHVLLTIQEYQRITHTGRSLAEALAMPEGEDICEDFDELLVRPRRFPRAADFD